VAATPPEVKPAPKLADRPSAAISAATGRWWVQVGSFGSQDNAQRVAQQLRAGGFTIEISQSRLNGKDLYRVRAGPVADRVAASALQARLVAAGQKNSALVAP